MAAAPFNWQETAPNPRLAILRREVEQIVLKPLQSHGWTLESVREVDHDDCIEVHATKGSAATKIAILYSSSGISNEKYRLLSQRVEHIFFQGQPYMLETFAAGIQIPVEPLGDFFPFLVKLNRRVEPDRSPATAPARPVGVRRLTAENPIEAISARLQQFTSVRLASKLVERRAEIVKAELPARTIASKATGVAFSMRSALDYISASASDKLIKRVLGLYYGSMAFAQAEMLASPTGPADLDEVEGMTKQGHGLYTLSIPGGGFADLRVGVLATGFLPQWLTFLGQDTTAFPTKKPRSASDLEKLPVRMVCTLRDLFSAMPEIDDLFAEVFGGEAGWLGVVYDSDANLRTPILNATGKKADSTYGLFIDRSGQISIDSIKQAGWPLAEIQVHETKGSGAVYRARVDHTGHDLWWRVLPTHSSPFGKNATLILPSVGNMREYRTIAATTLYALSIMARYMPSAWRRIEGGDEDHYLALVKAALAVWERILPEQFLESIAGEIIHTSQPGSFFG